METYEAGRIWYSQNWHSVKLTLNVGTNIYVTSEDYERMTDEQLGRMLRRLLKPLLEE